MTSHRHLRFNPARRRSPECSGALELWYRIMKRGRYASFAELKASFGSVDKVGPVFVFDIGGNKLRIVAAVHFNTGKVFIRHVLTHSEYDRGNWKPREGIQ